MGRVAERVGGGRSLRAAALTNGTVMLFIAAAARNWWELAALIAVAGVGNALTKPAANLLMARTIPPERHGIAFAVKQSAMPFGTLLGGLAVPVVTLTLGWRWAFAIGGVLAVAAALSVPRAGAPVGEGPHAVGVPTRPPTRPRVDTPLPLLAVFAIGVGLGAATASAQTTFLVSGAVDSGLGEGVAGLLLVLGSALGIASRLANGARADVRGGGHLRVVALMLLGGAAACAAFAITEPWSYVIATPLAFAAGWAWPGLFNLAIVRANPAAPGMATAITQTGTYVGAGVGPVVFGVIVGAGGYGSAWLVTASAALLAATAMLIGRGRLRALGLATGRS
jgi:MFS family permease